MSLTPMEALRQLRGGQLEDDNSVFYMLTVTRSWLAAAIARSAFAEKRKIGDPFQERLILLQEQVIQLHEDWPHNGE